MSRTIQAKIPGLAGLTTQCRGEQISFDEQGIGEADAPLMKEILACHPGTIIGEAKAPESPRPADDQLLEAPPDEAEGLDEEPEEAKGHPEGEQVAGFEEAPGAKPLSDDEGEEKTPAHDPPQGEVPGEVDLSALTIPNLKKLAHDLNVTLPEGAKKPEIIAALEPVVNPCTASAEG